MSCIIAGDLAVLPVDIFDFTDAADEDVDVECGFKFISTIDGEITGCRRCEVNPCDVDAWDSAIISVDDALLPLGDSSIDDGFEILKDDVDGPFLHGSRNRASATLKKKQTKNCIQS